MSIGKRIREARLAAGFTSQAALAKAIGCERATVTMWETDRVGQIGGEYLPALARVLNRSPEYLQTGKEARESNKIAAYSVRSVEDDGSDADPETDVMIPVVDVVLSAGNGHSVPEFVETKRQIPFQRYWLQRKRVSQKNLVIMKVSGDSMLPTLGDSYTVLIDRASTNIVDGKIYAIVVGEDAKIKRLRKLATGMVRIISDNPQFEPEELPSAEVLILGRAIHQSGEL